MRPFAYGSIIALSAAGGIVWSMSANGQQPTTAKATAEPARARIVPVVIVKPGECAELML